MRRHHHGWLVASGVRRGEELIAPGLLMLTGPSLSIESDPSHGELVRKASLGAREVVRVRRTTPKDVAKDIVRASRPQVILGAALLTRRAEPDSLG